MKVLILAAGYGTRLQRDLENDDSTQHNHLKNIPKPLLPIANKPLISYWIDSLKENEEISEICVVVTV